MWHSSAKSMNVTLTDALLFITGVLSSILNHNKRLIFIKNTDTVKHRCLSYINASALEYTYTYVQEWYKNSFEEVEIPSNTKKLDYVI